MAHSYGGTAAIWKHPIRHHQPSEPAALRLLKTSIVACLLGGWSFRSDHFLAYMHICRIYKKYTRVGDFDIRLRISLQVQVCNVRKYYKLGNILHNRERENSLNVCRTWM